MAYRTAGVWEAEGVGREERRMVKLRRGLDDYRGVVRTPW